MSLSSPRLLSVRDRVQLGALSALALLISVFLEMLRALALMVMPWGFVAVFDASVHFFIWLVETSAGQGVAVLLWAVISGVLFVFGVGRHAEMMRARIAALVSGVITPWMMLGIGCIERHLWTSFKETNGPMTHPLMTIPLLVCALLMPWLSGRAVRVDAQTRTVST